MTAPPAPRSPLVGRDRELSILRQHLDAALGGQGSLVLIGGEAGIGKTALAETLCREAAEQGTLVLAGRCHDLTETPPYGPWIELFAQYHPTASTPLLPTAFAQRGTVGHASSQAALFQQVEGFLADLAARQPLVLLLEDLHWADPVSLDLLRVVARSLAGIPLLLLATDRTDELTRHHPLYALLPTLVRETSAARIDLQRLTGADVRSLIAGRYPLPDADAARFVAYLSRRSEGNPFFLGELLRTLEADRLLHRTADGWTLGDVSRTRVPLLLRQVIDGRFARLEKEAQRLLAIAAVLGQEVPFALWGTVTQADQETVLAAVEHAADARLLEETADGRGARFVHALIREALYEGLPATQRHAWHRIIAETLAALPEADPDRVAYHFRQCGDARAVAWLIKAGERAERAYAWLTAAERFETAIALLPASTLGLEERGRLLVRHAWLRCWADPEGGIASLDVALRLAHDGNDAVVAACARYLRGILYCRGQDFRRGLADLEAGVAALDALPAVDQTRVQGFSLHGTALGALDRWGNLAMWLAYGGRYTETQTISERIVAAEVRARAAPTEAPHALALVDAALGRPAVAGRAFAHYWARDIASGNYAGMGQVALQELKWVRIPYYTDQVRERRALTAEIVTAWRRASGAYYGEDSPDLARLPLMVVEGAWDEACRLGSSAYAVQHRTVRRLLVARILAILARNRGERDRAWSLIEEWLPAPDAIQPGDVRFLDTLVLQRLAAALALDAGDLPTAREWLARHDAWLAWNGTVLGQAEGELGWAAYHRMAGDQARASAHANRALVLAGAPRQPLALIAAHRLLGELATVGGRFERAQQQLAASLALADACAAPYERALTLQALAELGATSGEPADACLARDEARTIAARLGAKPLLDRTDALTAGLTALSPARPAYPDGLTAREVDVLRLMASGKSNQEIAAGLFLSVRTVERHINSIYGKLQARTRAEATAYAFHHHLT